MKSSDTSQLSQDPENVVIAYDFTLMRPGCAIVQVALGATIRNPDLHRLDNWLTHPTPDMKLYPISRDQLERLIVLNNEKEES